MRQFDYNRIVKTRFKSAADGDTITVNANAALAANLREVGVSTGKTVNVRFFGIDAPERDQPFGKEARRAVKTSLGDYDYVYLKLRDVDQYGRVVAEVLLSDDEANYNNVNHYLLSLGLAVAYRRWLREKRTEYITLENEARRHGLNFWSQREVILPKKWRYLRRKEREQFAPKPPINPATLRA